MPSSTRLSGKCVGFPIAAGVRFSATVLAGVGAGVTFTRTQAGRLGMESSVADVRDVIPRASRPFESPMTLAVRNRAVTVAPYPSLDAAGADEPEADPAEAVAADPSVIDAERHPLYRDVVAAEHLRQSRLSRWQAQR